MELTEDILSEYFDCLWPICRSITGEGFNRSLGILSELIPLEPHTWWSREQCHDWVVPDEWNIRGARIINYYTEQVILDFADNNLHIVGYSEPHYDILQWKDLREHVHTVPELPNAVPYITSYYKRTWGFCMTHEQYLKLDEDPYAYYRVEIDASLKPGLLTVGDLVVPGKTEDEIFLASYLCHPSLANNELSGPLVLAVVYNMLKDKQLNHTIRYYIGPENIGAVCYLARYGFGLKTKMRAGFVVNCVGLGDEYTYKQSRLGESLADRAAHNVLKPNYVSKKFFPDGSDERQFCSPGYNLPVGVFMRRGYWAYPEYHTSLDNKQLISFDTMIESAEKLVDIILTVDKNKTYSSTVQKGTPQFSRNPQGEQLYASTMKLNSFYRGEGHRQAMLELVNWSDGSHDLLSIAEKYGRRVLDMAPVADMLVDAGYLVEVGNASTADNR